MKTKKTIYNIFTVAAALILTLAMTGCDDGSNGETSGYYDPDCQHLWSTTTWAVTTAPTETTDGVMSRKCIDCPHIAESVTVPAWNKFYGNWINTSSGSIAISATEYLRTNASGDFYKIGISSFKPIISTRDDKNNFPIGYEIIGTITEVQGSNWNDAIVVGGNYPVSIYLHTDGQSLVASGTGTAVLTK